MELTQTEQTAVRALEDLEAELSEKLMATRGALSVLTGNCDEAAAPSPRQAPAPRAESIDKDDADQAVIEALSQQDGLQIKEIAAAKGMKDGQVSSALKRLHDAGRVSKRGERPAYWSLVVPPPAETNGADGETKQPPAETNAAPAETPAESGLTDVEERVLIILLAKGALDTKHDGTFGDIQGAYNFEWGEDGAESLSPAVAHLIDEKLVVDRRVGDLHRYRLTTAGHQLAEQVTRPLNGSKDEG